VMHSFFPSGSSRCWSAWTWHSDWSIYWLLLCSGWSGSRTLIDICNMRMIQRWWGGGVLIVNFGGYGTPSLSGASLASQFGNTSLTMGKLLVA
jgi:hypothetical protein